MRAVFQNELTNLQERLIQLSDLRLDAIRDATVSFNAADIGLADQVISGDTTIDKLAVELDELAIEILTRQSPVARDLRIVVSGLRMSATLERMGDLARHIAQLTRRRYPDHVAPESLRDVFVQMSAETIRAAELLTRLLRTQDVALANTLIEDDRALDDLHRSVFDLVLAPDWSGEAEQIVDVILATRFLERFGDQAVSIARKALFLATGEWAPAHG